MARTMTDPDNWRFRFTITDLARYLGKSPVTLRQWEERGIIVFPRDAGGDRKFSTSDVRNVAKVAYDLKRITLERFRLIEASLFLIDQIEKANSRRGK